MPRTDQNPIEPPFYGKIDTEENPLNFRLQRSLYSKGTYPAPAYISNVLAYLRIVLRESCTAMELATRNEDIETLNNLRVFAQDTLQEFEERYRL